MGTWLEIPIDRAEIIAGGVPPDRLPQDPHVTLLYMDRVERSLDQIEIIREAVEMHVKEYPRSEPIRATVSGCGEFLVGPRRVPVLLVNSYAIGGIRWDVEFALDELHQKFDTNFGFQPHITLTDGPPWRLPRAFYVTIRSVDLVHSKDGNQQRWSIPL